MKPQQNYTAISSKATTNFWEFAQVVKMSVKQCSGLHKEDNALSHSQDHS